MTDEEKLRVARTALRAISKMSVGVTRSRALEALALLGPGKRRIKITNDLLPCDGSQNDLCRLQSTRCDICPLFGKGNVSGSKGNRWEPDQMELFQ